MREVPRELRWPNPVQPDPEGERPEAAGMSGVELVDVG